MIKVIGLSKRKWAAFDKSKALRQPQPRMKVKQTKQRKCMYEKNIPPTNLHSNKPTNPQKKKRPCKKRAIYIKAKFK